MQEGDEPPAEARPVEIDEVFVLPMGLEIRRFREAEFAGLSRAVAVPAAVDLSDEVDVCDVEAEGWEEGCGDGVNGIGFLVGVEVGEEDGEADG